MKHIFLSLVIFIVACSTKLKEKSSAYFEGMVEFKIDIHSPSVELDSLLRKQFGDYSTTYIKDSFVSRVLYNYNNLIVGRQILRTDSMKEYVVHEQSDTMLVTDLSNDYYFSNISTKEVAGKKIAGKNTLGVEMVNLNRSGMFADPYTTTTIYYFDTSIMIAPYIHSKIKYGSYDKIFSKYHYLTLGYESDYNGTKFSMLATKIIRNKVNPIFFDVPQNKVSINPFLQ